MESPVEEVQEALRKLEVVQQQQKASLAGMQLLASQHQEWQAAVTQLLDEADALLLLDASATSSPTRKESKSSLPVRWEASIPLSLRSGRVSACSATSGNSELNEPIPQELESIKMDDMDERGKFLRLNAVSFLRKAPQLPSSNNVVGKGPVSKLIMELMPQPTLPIPRVPLGGWSWLRQKTRDIVTSQWFETMAGFIILINLITIGAEAQLSLDAEANAEHLHFLGILEHIFLVIYSVEVLLRVMAGGWSVFCDLWFLMDLFLVSIGILALVVFPGIFTIGLISPIQGFETFLVVRGLRLLRLVRALRTFRYFKIMWRLVYALLSCGSTILSTTLLIVIFLFICACVAIEVIAKDQYLLANEVSAKIIDDHFLGLFKAALTFLQFVTMDSIASVYFPLLMLKPQLFAFFAPILMFISIGLMNLVTAALVENAMEQTAVQAEEDKKELQQQLKRAIPALIDVFRDLDTDKNGMLTYEELEGVPMEDFVPGRLLESIHVETMADFFHYLDVDGSGNVSQTEFVEGLLNLCLQDVPIWTIQTLKLLRRIHEEVEHVHREISALKQPR
ncbi:scn4aa [Symbiodinium natans]|uniref:Scn4aa protein n=1 Tax=Symbiodinium natans TaxID=878477 RepID=A0A812MC07_9DINO|nr:scn4aa [Symbiodinium natans]